MNRGGGGNCATGKWFLLGLATQHLCDTLTYTGLRLRKVLTLPIRVQNYLEIVVFILVTWVMKEVQFFDQYNRIKMAFKLVHREFTIEKWKCLWDPIQSEECRIVNKYFIFFRCASISCFQVVSQ